MSTGTPIPDQSYVSTDHIIERRMRARVETPAAANTAAAGMLDEMDGYFSYSDDSRATSDSESVSSSDHCDSNDSDEDPGAIEDDALAPSAFFTIRGRGGSVRGRGGSVRGRGGPVRGRGGSVRGRGGPVRGRGGSVRDRGADSASPTPPPKHRKPPNHPSVHDPIRCVHLLF